MEYNPQGYLEQVCPLGMNLTQVLTNVAADKDFVADNDRGASGLLFTNDSKVQKAFLHIVGVAVNTYTYENGLDCATATHNQLQMNLDGGAYSDLVNGAKADGQMLNNDWRCPLEGSLHTFHLAFDVTSQVTNIDGKIGIKLQNGRSLQSSLYITISTFLRVIWEI